MITENVNPFKRKYQESVERKFEVRKDIKVKVFRKAKEARSARNERVKAINIGRLDLFVAQVIKYDSLVGVWKERLM